MRFDIITIFPRIFDSYFSESILKRAQKNKLIQIIIHDLRRWASDRHKTVDDSPYGGGPGMILKIEPIYKAIEEIKARYAEEKIQTKSKTQKTAKINRQPKIRIILFSAKGKLFTQKDARRLSKYDQLILICGRYEGVDERVAKHIAQEEVSVGNFVLTGGEIPAMILVDAISRLVPGVLGKKESLVEESFSKRLSSVDYPLSGKKSFKTANCGLFFADSYLEYPQYTRPENFRGWKVPKVLLSGNHKKIKEWREKQSKKIKPV